MTTTRGSTNTSLFIYVKDAVSSKVNRLAIPADTQIGTVDKPAELMLTGRFSMNTRTVDVKNGSTVSMSNNDTILCVNEIDSSTIGAATIFLPSSPREGQIHHVKDVGGSSHLINIIVKPALTTQSIDGDSSETIFTPYGSVSYFWSNGVWRSLQGASGAAGTVNLFAGTGIGIVTGSISGSTTYTINSLGALASYVVISATSSLANERALAGSHGVSIFDGGAGSNVTISAEGLESAPYVTFGLTSSLSNEKVLTAGTNITITTSSNTITVSATSAGGGDPGASYLVLNATASLSNERVIQAGFFSTISSSTSAVQVDVDVANQLQPLLFNPVAAWAFRGAPNSATLWYDRTGHGNDFQGGTATPIPDLILSQSAVSSVVLSGTHTQLNITGTLTLTSRVKIAGFGTAQVLIDVGTLGLGCTYLVGLDNTGHIYYFHETPGSPTFAMPNVPDFGEWVFVSLRRNSSGVITLGVNDQFATSTALGLPSSGAGLATLGTNDGKITPWLGQIADMVVWDVYLTDAQLADQRKVALGPLAYYTRHTGSALDNSIARFDQGPEAIQTSLVTINDAGSITLPALQTVDGRDLSVDGIKLDTVEAGAQVTSATRVVTALGLTTSSITVGTTLQTSFVGSLSASGGLTGSLQEVAPGVPYLIPGANVTILTNSLGQVMISAAAGGGSGGLESYVLATATGSLPNSRVLSASTGLIFTDNGPTSTVDYRIDDNFVATISGSRFRGPVVGLAGFTGSIFTTPAGLSFIAGSQGVTVTSASNGQITLGVNNNIVATITGSAFQQLSGSLQQTAAGVSYLVAGANIVITSASNGQITITSAAVITGSSSVGGDPGAPYITFGTTSSLSNERLLVDGIGTRVSQSAATTIEIDAYPWIDAFDINFAVMPTMTASNGNFTMAGYTWRGNNITSGADFVGIVNGDGLRIDTNGSSTDFFNGNETAPIVRLNVADVIPKFNLIDYELRLWTQMSSTLQNQDFEINSVGFTKQDFNSSLRYRVWNVQRFGGGIYNQYGNFDWNSTEGAASTTAPSLGNVHILHLQNLRTASLYSGLSTASYATPNSIAFPDFALFTLPAPMIVSLATPPITGSRDLAISFAAMTFNTANSFSSSIQRMKLQYRIKSAEMPTNFVPNTPSYLMLTASGQLVNERYLVAGTNISFNDAGAGGAFTISAATGSGGGGAGETAASYVVLAATSSLSNERVLVAGNGVSLTDTGPGGNVIVGINTTTMSGSSGWATALDLNLTQDGNFTFVDGPNTWHGLTWTGRNIATYTSQFAIVSGTGLFIDYNTSNSIHYPPTGADTGAQIIINLADLIPSFELNSTRVRVTMQFDCNAAASFEYAEFGIERPASLVAGQSHLIGVAKFVDNSSDLGTSTALRRSNVYYSGGQRWANTQVARSSDIMCIDYSFDSVEWFSTSGSAPGVTPNSSVFNPLNYRMDSRMMSGSSLNVIPMNSSASYFLSGTNRGLQLYIGGFTGNTAGTLTNTFTRLRVEYQNPATTVAVAASVASALTALSPSYYQGGLSGSTPGLAFTVNNTWTDLLSAVSGGTFTDDAQVGISRSSGNFTVTSAGLYMIHVNCSFYDPSAAPLLGLRCRQNGVVRFSQQAYLDRTASATTFGASGVLMLNASDVITFQYCISNSSTAVVALTAGQMGGTNPSLMNINMVRIPSV